MGDFEYKIDNKIPINVHVRLSDQMDEAESVDSESIEP